jgi:hypothetical protein
MGDPSFFDVRHSGEITSATFSSNDDSRPAQSWKIYLTGCLGNVERILR